MGSLQLHICGSRFGNAHDRILRKADYPESQGEGEVSDYQSFLARKQACDTLASLDAQSDMFARRA